MRALLEGITDVLRGATSRLPGRLRRLETNAGLTLAGACVLVFALSFAVTYFSNSSRDVSVVDVGDVETQSDGRPMARPATTDDAGADEADEVDEPSDGDCDTAAASPDGDAAGDDGGTAERDQGSDPADAGCEADADTADETDEPPASAPSPAPPPSGGGEAPVTTVPPTDGGSGTGGGSTGGGGSGGGGGSSGTPTTQPTRPPGTNPPLPTTPPPTPETTTTMSVPEDS